jgi:cysteine synthase B
VARALAPSLLDLVGNTPLVELARLSPKPAVRLYAKLEGQNPTGSIKDRIAVSMIEAAEAAGELVPGRELLEPTSGNTGISLALVAKLKGYPLTCVMPENATEERRRLLRLYGARIIESPGSEGSNGAVRLALELAEREPRYFMPFQYGNQANPRAHYEGTGAEIAEALDHVDVLVAGLGTGGTLMGAGERLRESFPDVVVAAAEPLPGDPVMGLRSLDEGYVPPILDVEKLDRKLLVSNAESVVGVRALLDREGIFGGVSSGAVLHVAARLAEELDEGGEVAVLVEDGAAAIAPVEGMVAVATQGSTGVARHVGDYRVPAGRRQAKSTLSPLLFLCFSLSPLLFSARRKRRWPVSGSVSVHWISILPMGAQTLQEHS